MALRAFVTRATAFALRTNSLRSPSTTFLLHSLWNSRGHHDLPPQHWHPLALSMSCWQPAAELVNRAHTLSTIGGISQRVYWCKQDTKSLGRWVPWHAGQHLPSVRWTREGIDILFGAPIAHLPVSTLQRESQNLAVWTKELSYLVPDTLEKSQDGSGWTCGWVWQRGWGQNWQSVVRHPSA